MIPQEPRTEQHWGEKTTGQNSFCSLTATVDAKLAVKRALIASHDQSHTLTKPPVLVQGLQYLVENGLLDHGAEPVAEFLYKEEGLNKTAIGSFLGEKYTDLLKILSPDWLLLMFLSILMQKRVEPGDPEGLCGPA